MPDPITPDTTSGVKVLVVDDQQLMRDGIASLLGVQAGIRVVGTADNGQTALEQARLLQPDVVLMDVRMPVMNGVEATRLLRQEQPGCRVLMLTTFEDDEYVMQALQAGATGYLLKNIPAADLAQVIQTAHKGVYQLDPAVAAKLVQALNRAGGFYPARPAEDGQASSFARPDDLTNREIEVLRLLAKGISNRAIAERLFISEGTVKNHVSNILSRLGLTDRNQAALYARRHNLI